jgi:hypothetical protein
MPNADKPCWIELFNGTNPVNNIIQQGKPQPNRLKKFAPTDESGQRIKTINGKMIWGKIIGLKNNDFALNFFHLLGCFNPLAAFIRWA